MTPSLLPVYAHVYFKSWHFIFPPGFTDVFYFIFFSRRFTVKIILSKSISSTIKGSGAS